MNPYDEDSSGLYRWKRSTPESKPTSSSKKTPSNEIEKWTKKVELAADDAISVAFGHKQVTGRQYQTADDSTYSEARSLLNQWMATKDLPPSASQISPSESLEDLLPWADLDDQTTPGGGVPTRCQVRREWDHLMNQLGVDHRATQHQTDSSRRVDRGTQGDPQGLHHNQQSTAEDVDDSGAAVDAIVQRLMAKEYVPKAKLRAKDQPPRVDWKMKMDLRQEQAKERREQKRSEEEMKRKEAIARRDAETEARKMILQEERDRVADIKREEELIQKEMLKIRKEMQSRRAQDEERQKREAKDFAALEKRIHPDGGGNSARSTATNKSKATPLGVQDLDQGKLDDLERRKLQITQLISNKEKQNLSEKLKLLQRCFASWFSIILERRMQTGRAAAIADWRSLRRNFHAWRDVARSYRLDREVKALEIRTRDEQRKLNLADGCCRRKMLRKCFFSWKIFTRHEQDNRAREEFEAKKRSKMASFLEAASRLQMPPEQESAAPSDRNNLTSPKSDIRVGPGVRDSKQSVDELFAAASNHNAARQPAGPIKNARSSCSGSLVSNRSPSPARRQAGNRERSATNVQKSQFFTPNGRRIVRPPTEAWQVTRNHVGLPIDQLVSVDNDEDSETPPLKQHTGSQSYRETSTGIDPESLQCLKPPKMVNQFENRHKAQQKILSEQQKQLREQQRLIEELQSNQKRQLLDQELQAQTLAQSILEKVSTKSVPTSSKAITAVVDGDNAFSPNADVFLEAVGGIGFITAETVERPGISPGSTGPSSTVDSGRDTKKSTFVKKMEARAAERSRLKAEREFRQKQKEEERLSRLEEEIQLRKQEEEAERQEKIKQYQQKKRLEKQRELARQEYMEHLQQLSEKGASLRTRSLLRFYGWLPWRRLMETRQRQEQRACEHYDTELMGRVFEAWMLHTQHNKAVEDGLVESFQSRILIRRYFSQWKKYKNHAEMMEIRADQWNAYRVEIRVFTAWRDFSVEEKLERKRKEHEADIFDQNRIGRRCLRAWRRFPELERLDREKEKRKAELRRRVASLVPDFVPMDDLTGSTNL